MGELKGHINVDPNVMLHFFSGKTVITHGSISQLHQRHKREDGIMYVQYIRLEAYG